MFQLKSRFHTQLLCNLAALLIEYKKVYTFIVFFQLLCNLAALLIEYKMCVYSFFPPSALQLTGVYICSRLL
jgi:hypothetical protein